MGRKIRRVLLVGNGAFYHLGAFFRKALKKLGYEVCFVDEGVYFRGESRSLLQKGLTKLLGKPLWACFRFNRLLLEQARSFQPDLLFVIKGSYVQRDVLEEIRSGGRTLLVNYATDNPFNPLGSTDEVVKAIDLYDLYVSTKKFILHDLHQTGAKRVLWVPFGYEPSLHFPERLTETEGAQRWASDVMFAGGCDQDRNPFFGPLAGLSDFALSLYGGYWDRHKEFRRFWKGFAYGRDYRLAIGGSKIALNLVRHANQDGHTMRTFEIPACGGFLLAERTSEHLEFFEEGKEMACFSSPEEMVDKVRYYLRHENQRLRIAETGHEKLLRGRHTYRDRLMDILRAVDGYEI